MIILENQALKIEILEECGFTVSKIIFDNHNILYFPFSEGDYKNNYELAGIPFLYPWANRLSSIEFELYKKKINLSKAQIMKDKNGLLLHGILLKTDLWRIKELKKNYVIAELNFKNDLYEIFPFHHKIEYKIQVQNYEVDFLLTIFPEEDLPISFGFHPYFSLQGYDYKQISIYTPVRSWIQTDEFLIPVKKLPVEEYYKKFNTKQSLDHYYDDTFTDFFYRDDFAIFELKYPDKILQIYFDVNYKVVQIYYPFENNKIPDFICIEPMTNWPNSFISHQFEIIKQKKEFYFKIAILNLL